jgi:hypothetical protein
VAITDDEDIVINILQNTLIPNLVRLDVKPEWAKPNCTPGCPGKKTLENLLDKHLLLGICRLTRLPSNRFWIGSREHLN